MLVADRVRQHFERGYREREKALIAYAKAIAAETRADGTRTSAAGAKETAQSFRTIAREQHARARAQRDRFLDSDAFGRVLAALEPNDVESAAHILRLLGWIDDTAELRAATDPAEALGLPTPKSKLADELAERIEQLDVEKLGGLVAAALELPSADVDVRALAAVLNHVEGLRRHVEGLRRAVPHVVRRWQHAWVTPTLEPGLLGKRGGASARAGAWRGLLVRELAVLLPHDVEDRSAAIADLLELAGDDGVSRQKVLTMLERSPVGERERIRFDVATVSSSAPERPIHAAAIRGPRLPSAARTEEDPAACRTLPARLRPVS